MNRLRLYDVRVSRLGSVLGICQDDVRSFARYVNSAQRRLIYAKECGDEGWWGTWAEIAFNVSCTQPYLTLPRDVARLEAVTICNKVIPVQNQFYEYLSFGNGRMPQNPCWRNAVKLTAALTRNNAVTSVEMTSAPQYVTIYATNAGDVGKRVIIQGTDSSGNVIYSQDDTGATISGTIVTLNSPSATTTMTLSTITGIQKDQTIDPVRIYQHDPVTAAEILLLTMEPSEMTASYRRYYLDDLPRNCCADNSSTTVQLTALAKLDLIPVQSDTDYLLIQNLEAIIEECQAVRYSEQDNPISKQMAAERHAQAIAMLNGELNHFLGSMQPAIGFFPFGSAKLRRLKVGNMQ